MTALVPLIAAALGIAPAAAPRWDYAPPGRYAYCRFEALDAFRCVRPRDGLWLRLAPLSRDAPPRVTRGVAARFRGVRGSVAVVGPRFSSSDARLMTCRSDRRGLTCKHYEGLSFWLGRRVGWRIFFGKPGFRPLVRPLFRTPRVWCGIDLAVLEPLNPLLKCWRPSDGLLMALAHDDAGAGAGYSREEQAEAFRPRGFPALRAGATVSWRCRQVERRFAEGCSTTRGSPVFTCRADTLRITCRNRGGRGFWISARSFYAF